MTASLRSKFPCSDFVSICNTCCPGSMLLAGPAARHLELGWGRWEAGWGMLHLYTAGVLLLSQLPGAISPPAGSRKGEAGFAGEAR